MSEDERVSDGSGRTAGDGRRAAGEGERAVDQSGRAAAEVGVPLTITPPLEKHRLDAWFARERGRKGMEPKAMARIRRGAAGLFLWNSASFSGALLTWSAFSQVLPSVP